MASAAGAHPLSQGALEVVVFPDRVAVNARVTLEEVEVTNILVPAPAPEVETSPASARPTGGEPAGAAGAETTDPKFARHARYFAAHLHISVGSEPLIGRFVRAGAPATPPGSIEPAVTYELEYRPTPPADGGRPRDLLATANNFELCNAVLTDASFLPGTTWETSYVIRIIQSGGPAAEGMLLTAEKPITFELAARPPAQAGDEPRIESSVPAEVRVDRKRLAGDYLWHGVSHILHGYDHLLFISALVLAATGGWDLVRLVTAFTLAHTVTLTLAALNLVRVPGCIVEPMIAASIVFVAVQNVFWPRSSRGWGRLGAAFVFGLFHGLGFAGGLLDAMQGMRGSTILLAIVAFSIGVELGHQMIVLPLFASLQLARRMHSDELARTRASLRAQRVGSALIAVVGMFYLFVAVRVGFFGGGGL